jgi:hypothetical protein
MLIYLVNFKYHVTLALQFFVCGGYKNSCFQDVLTLDRCVIFEKFWGSM